MPPYANKKKKTNPHCKFKYNKKGNTITWCDCRFCPPIGIYPIFALNRFWIMQWKNALICPVFLAQLFYSTFIYIIVYWSISGPTWHSLPFCTTVPICFGESNGSTSQWKNSILNHLPQPILIRSYLIWLPESQNISRLAQNQNIISLQRYDCTIETSKCRNTF